MRSLFYTLRYWFYWLFGVIPRSAMKSQYLYLGIHYSVIVLATLALGYFSDRIMDPADLKLPFYFLRRFWCGILFLLAYLFVRLVIYLIGLLRIQDEPEFADIDRAWAAGIEGLQREGLDLRWLAAFVVNGLTVDQERNLIHGSRMDWKVVAPPLEDRSAVLRFFANDDAVFISCTGVGATSRQLSRVNVAGGVSAPVAPGREAEAAGTLRREDLIQAQAAAAGGTIRAVPQPSPAGGDGATMQWAQQVIAQQTIQPGGLGGAAAGVPHPAVAQPAVVKSLDPADEARAVRRMEYFCHLLIRDRDPYCSANGLLQASPISWSANQHDQTKLCPAAAIDLETICHELQLQMPVVLMFSELEVLDGFEEFLDRCGKVDPRFRDSRAGSRFPAGAPIDSDHAQWAIERSLQWFRGWIYSAFSADLENPGNRKMYQLLCELSDRRHRLEYQLKRTLEFRKPMDEPVRLSGCYLAATGRGTKQQGFLKGVLLKLQSEQNEVAWNRRLLRRDALCRAWSWILFVAAGGLAAADVYLLWQIIHRNSSG